MATPIVIPNFGTGREEAERWDAHPEAVTVFQKGEEGGQDKAVSRGREGDKVRNDSDANCGP